MGAILTADLVAHALIAAARVYGDDPIVALQAEGRSVVRRTVTAACAALNRAGYASFDFVERVLGVKRSSIYTARSKKLGDFAPAEAAAFDAIGGIPAGSTPVASPPAPSRAAQVPPDQRAPVVTVRNPMALAAHKARVLSAGATRREVFEALKQEPGTPPDLAERLSFSVVAVRQALDELIEGGEVRRDPMTQEGWRVQFWRVAEAVPS